MKAVILVGGEGTRLRPLTIHRPKPMQPVANRPFIEHVFRHLKTHGVNDIILSMCYLPGIIQEYFGDGSAFGVHLTYVTEEQALGTAGAVKNAEMQGLLTSDEPVFVLNGDILTDLDLRAMLAFHRAHGALGTIALTPVEDVRAYGLVDCDESGRVQRFIEKPKSLEGITTNLINAGTYILEPAALRLVPPNQFYQFEQALFPHLLREGDALFGYPSEGYWLDIGTPEKYKTANVDMLLGQIAACFEGEQRVQGVWVGPGCEIDPSAELIGPVVLGKRCVVGAGARLVGPVVLGDGCEIGPGVHLERAVLWEQVRVGLPTSEPIKVDATIKTDVTQVRNSLVGTGCTIGSGCQLDGVVIADHCMIGFGNMLSHGLKLWPHRTLEPQTITF
ncbi:MAG TPA: NDP-sugar synthase [Ktedonobacterales bacterium]|nr:NDP-sugar synthase [Ktedonobacterales bacterium]